MRKNGSSAGDRNQPQEDKRRRSPKQVNGWDGLNRSKEGRKRRRGSSSGETQSSRYAKDDSTISWSPFAYDRICKETIRCRCCMCGKLRRIPPHDRADPSSDPRVTSPVWYCSNFLNLPCSIPNETWNDVLYHFYFAVDPAPAEDEPKMVVQKAASPKTEPATTTYNNINNNRKHQNHDSTQIANSWRASDIPLGFPIYYTDTEAHRLVEDTEQINEIYREAMLLMEESKQKDATRKQAPTTQKQTTVAPATAPATVSAKRKLPAMASATPDVPSSSSMTKARIAKADTSTGRRRSRRGTTDDSQILSLPYKYNGMDWDPIARCWVPKHKIKLPPKKNS